MILAIDPGTDYSAWVLLTEDTLLEHGRDENNAVLLMLRNWDHPAGRPRLVIEMIASYGMPVGHEIFETCVWIGRFMEAWDGPCDQLFRREVKHHLCGSSHAKDANVRRALLDKYPRTGGGKTPQVGTKSKPGPLYGVSKDIWAALGVGVTYLETKGGV